jgi:PAS domain S-box-containing protein
LDQDSAIAPLALEVPYEGAPDLAWLNHRLRDLLMHAPSAIGITVGPEHRWAYVNEARAAMAGRAGVEAFIGKTARQTYPELEGAPFFTHLDDVYRTGVTFKGQEIRAPFNRGPHGTPNDAYLDVVYQPIRGPEGNVEGLLIHSVEVTQQVQARRAVELANEREKRERATAEFERNQLRELFKQAPAGISILSGPDHRWSFANAAYCVLLGRTREQLLNRTIRETLPELEGQGFFELLDQVYRTGTPYIGKEVKGTLNRGPGQSPQEGYFDFIYQPVFNVAGEVEAIMALAVDITEQFQARTQLESRVQERTIQLQQAHESLRMLSSCLMQAQDEERRRVARELHDSTGQYLAAVQMNLAALAADPALQPDNLRRRMADTIDLVVQCTAEIRTLSYLLHPPLLDDVGLASAISWYVEGFAERSGISVTLDIPKTVGRFLPEIETALFRIVQQSLTNIHRHSHSKVAHIRLALDDSHLKLEISDKGHGFEPQILSRFEHTGQLPGMGISGMRERMNALRGSFEITSNVSGATIAVSVPVHQ